MGKIKRKLKKIRIHHEGTDQILYGGIGLVLVALLLTILLPTRCDRKKGLSLMNFWLEIKEAFCSYRNKNQDMRRKEEENFGPSGKWRKNPKDN